MNSTVQTSPGKTNSPEIGKSFRHGTHVTNYHDVGAGQPVLLIHGSGPGVTAWANWRGVMPELAERARVIAPDMLGFGYTQCSLKDPLDLDAWVAQIATLLDALAIDSLSIVGNSFGGAVALAFAVKYPQRVQRLVLMGSTGISFPLTDGLNKAWGYQPSLEGMKELLRVFAFDHSIITDDLVAMRYAASIRDDVQTRFAQLFPQPRQRGIDLLAQDETVLRKLQHPTLLVHGREDRVIPLAVSQRMAELIPNADLHVFAKTGHWVQIERQQAFLKLVSNFLLG